MTFLEFSGYMNRLNQTTINGILRIRGEKKYTEEEKWIRVQVQLNKRDESVKALRKELEIV